MLPWRLSAASISLRLNGVPSGTGSRLNNPTMSRITARVAIAGTVSMPYFLSPAAATKSRPLTQL
jgi:hypothetical protein